MLDGRGAGIGVRIARPAVMAVLLACVLNSAIRQVATVLFGVPETYEHLEWRDFLSTTAAAVVLAGLTAAVMQRFAARPQTRFLQLCLGVFVLSLGGPLSLLADGVQGGTVATLATMHVATAAVVIGLLVPAINEGTSSQS